MSSNEVMPLETRSSGCRPVRSEMLGITMLTGALFAVVMLAAAGAAWAQVPASNPNSAGATPVATEAAVAEVRAYFARQQKTVVTFVGYSDAGYEDPSAMLAEARRRLQGYDPEKTIVNVGATPSGIGAVYELAKKMGFATTGIVSSQAKKYAVPLSLHVDRVFFIPDETWGGRRPGSDELQPTSQAMVDCSDVLIGIGGGEVGRDELVFAKRRGKTVHFVAADMNHAVAREKARRKGLPAPTSFRGAAAEELAK